MLFSTVTINKLRFVSFVEGVSYLMVLFIGMPLKYGMGIGSVNKVLGMTHGIITIVFCMILLQIWLQDKLNFKWSVGVFIASLIPFGAFVAESKLKQL